MPVRLRGVHAGVAREADDRRVCRARARPRVGAAGVGPHHVPRRIADHGVESRARTAAAVGVEERLRKLELPVKQAPRLAERERAIEKPRGHGCRQIATAGERRVGQRSERRRRRRGVACEPGGAPEMRHLLPPRQRRIARGQRGIRALLRAHLLDRVVRQRLEREAHRQRVAHRVRNRFVLEQRKAVRRTRGAPHDRRPPELREPGAEQAVAGLQAMIEEAQRTIGGERREPERQARELHRHRVEIDAVQAAFGDRASNGRAFRLADVARETAARLDERRLVRGREISARGHQKGAAAHRRIDDAEAQDVLRRPAADERPERPTDDEVGDRLRRVERARRLPDSGSRLQRDAVALDDGRVVEQRFVDGAELLDAEIAVRDPLAPAARRRGPRRQRDDGAARGVVVEIAAIGERRPRGREEPAVERRHAQLAGAAAGMREPRHRAQRVPQTGGARRSLRIVAHRLDAVALAIDRVPERDERARLREQQKQDAIDDRQRLLERLVDRDRAIAPARSPARQRAKDFGRRRQHAVAQRTADARRMTIRRGDECVQRAWIRGARAERRRMARVPERGECARLIVREIEIEVERAPGVHTRRVHDSQPHAVGEKTPAGASPLRFDHRDAPQRIERFAPDGGDQRDRPLAAVERRRRQAIGGLDPGWPVEAKDRGKRRGRTLHHRARRRRRAQIAGGDPRALELPPRAFDALVRRGDLRLEKRCRYQATVHARQHRTRP